MKINNQIVAQAEEFASEYLFKKLRKDFCYHSFLHTRSVVNGVDLLCTATGVSKAEKRILLIAAWFHDLGHVQQICGHEKVSTRIATQFLRNRKINDEEIAIVNACILATQMPQQPKNQLEQIICDADLLYLGTANFIIGSNQLRQEWANTINTIYANKEWYQLNIQFLKNHRFHLQYSRKRFDTGKANNIKRLLIKLMNSEDATTNKIAA